MKVYHCLVQQSSQWPETLFHVCQKPSSLLKRDNAAHQRIEWHLDIFQAKAVKVYGVPQEKVQMVGRKKISLPLKHLSTFVVRKGFEKRIVDHLVSLAVHCSCISIRYVAFPPRLFL
jgi:hypothetical protein